MTNAVADLIKAVLPRSNARFRDPLGRDVGESLDRNRFSDEIMREKEQNIGPREWGSVWMQNPVVEGAGLLDRKVFQSKKKGERRILSPTEFDDMTEGLKWSRFYDFAYTTKQYNKADPDFTVGSKIAFKVDPWSQFFDIFVYDQVRYRARWGRVKENVRDQAFVDGEECHIGAEGNGPQAGAVEDIQLDPKLTGFIIVRLIELPDPQVWTSRAQIGRMWLRAGDWTGPFFDEFEAYPNGTHDDTVKSMCGGYVMAATRAQEYKVKVGKARIPFTKRWGT